MADGLAARCKSRAGAKNGDCHQFALSVPYVWVIDPAGKRGYICTREGKQEATEGVLETDNPSIKLDLRVLF